MTILIRTAEVHEIEELTEFLKLAAKYEDKRPVRQAFLVPKEEANHFSSLLHKFVDPSCKITRRARGPRLDYSHNSRMEDAHSVGFYITK